MHASDDFPGSLARITSTAEQAIHGCEAASISLLTRDGPATFGATHALADEGDQIQYDEGEGPCLDAAMEEQWVYTPDLAVDPRWTRSAARLSLQLGVHSMFSTRLTLDAAPNDTLGGMNMYATRPDAFSEQDQLLALLLSSLAAVVVDASRQQEHYGRPSRADRSSVRPSASSEHSRTCRASKPSRCSAAHRSARTSSSAISRSRSRTAPGTAEAD